MFVDGVFLLVPSSMTRRVTDDEEYISDVIFWYAGRSEFG